MRRAEQKTDTGRASKMISAMREDEMATEQGIRKTTIYNTGKTHGEDCEASGHSRPMK